MSVATRKTRAQLVLERLIEHGRVQQPSGPRSSPRDMYVIGSHLHGLLGDEADRPHRITYKKLTRT